MYQMVVSICRDADVGESNDTFYDTFYEFRGNGSGCVVKEAILGVKPKMFPTPLRIFLPEEEYTWMLSHISPHLHVLYTSLLLCTRETSRCVEITSLF
jgi:hypothetical protein